MKSTENLKAQFKIRYRVDRILRLESFQTPGWDYDEIIQTKRN